MSKSESREKTAMIMVRATPEEKEALRDRAKAFGVSMGELCRRAIFGTKLPKSVIDQKAIADLQQVRADMGRLGGLLKGWLSGSFIDGAGMPMDHEADLARKLLGEIEKNQALMTAHLQKGIMTVHGMDSEKA